MVVPGFGVIDSDNLTIEKYEYLLKLAPAHAEQFIVSDEMEKIKPIKNEQSNLKA